MSAGRLVLLVDFDWVPWRPSAVTPAVVVRLFDFARQKGWIVTFRVTDAADTALPVLQRAIRDEGHVLKKQVEPGSQVLQIDPQADWEEINTQARELIGQGFVLGRD